MTQLGNVVTQNSDGTETSRLSYTYNSADYYVQYTTRCFNYESKMCDRQQDDCVVTEQDDCYCRRPLPAGVTAPADCKVAN